MKSGYRTPLLILALAFALALPASAQQPAEPYPDKPAEQKKPERVLTPEEKAEKAERRICKVKICSIFSSKDPQGADVDCPVTKTWREEDIEEILGNQFTWPWGKARCSTRLRLSRPMLAAAASKGETKAKLDRHTIACSLDLKSDGQTYDVKVNIAPEVTFRDGKAVSSRINWGDVEAPMLAYSVIWPGAALDNSTNMLQGPIVDMINEFMGKKCAEVKDQLPLRASLPPGN